KRLIRLLAFRPRQHLPGRPQPVEEAVADWRELQKAAAPNRVERQRLGVEAAGELALVSESNANAFGHPQPASSVKDAAQHSAQVGLVPAVVAPDVVVLISPVAQLTAVQPGKGREQMRPMTLPAEEERLFEIEVVEAVAVDLMLPERPHLRIERRAVEC